MLQNFLIPEIVDDWILYRDVAGDGIHALMDRKTALQGLSTYSAGGSPVYEFSRFYRKFMEDKIAKKKALSMGMTLKDASAYNIQFLKNKPIHIDTLSFEKLFSEKPWRAYQQFCQHFLAPLALMSYISPDLNNMNRTGTGLPPTDFKSVASTSSAISAVRTESIGIIAQKFSKVKSFFKFGVYL